MIILRNIFLALFLITMVSCSSITVKHDYDPGIEFSSYKTYNIFKKNIKGDALSENRQVKKRVLIALEKVLIQKGYTKSSRDEADFIVIPQAGIKDRVEVTSWGGYSWYRPGWGVYGYHDVSYYEEGNLIINIVDRKNKELAWRGVATGTIEEYPTREEREEYLLEVIEKVLSSFPPEI